MSLQVCKTEDLPPLDVPVVYTSELNYTISGYLYNTI